MDVACVLLLVVRLAWVPLPFLPFNITWPWASFSTSVSFSFLIYKIMIINTFFTALSEIMHIKCLARECLNMVMVEAGQELNNENIAVTCVLWFLGTHSQDCAFWVTGWEPNCRRFWVMYYLLTLLSVHVVLGSWTLGSLAFIQILWCPSRGASW